MCNRMAASCTNMPEAQPEYCVAYHVLVRMPVVHLTEHTVMMQVVMKGLHSPDIIQSFSEMVVRIMYSLPPDVMWCLR